MGHYLFDLCPIWVLYPTFKIMSIKQIDFSEVLRDDQVYNTIFQIACLPKLLPQNEFSGPLTALTSCQQGAKCAQRH